MIFNPLSTQMKDPMNARPSIVVIRYVSYSVSLSSCFAVRGARAGCSPGRTRLAMDMVVSGDVTERCRPRYSNREAKAESSCEPRSMHQNIRSCIRSMILGRSLRACSRFKSASTTRRIVIPSYSIDELDAHILSTAHNLLSSRPTSLHELIGQYHTRAGLVLDHVLPYGSYPESADRADRVDGVVMIAHIALANDGTIGKLVVSSGFAVAVQGGLQGDVIISCAHTLDEIHRNIEDKLAATMSIVFPSQAPARPVTALLTSLPHRDLVVLQTSVLPGTSRLPTLPVSPYAIGPCHPLLGHIVGSPAVPPLKYNKVDIPHERAVDRDPQRWVGELGWKRWGPCHMLGYRDGRGREVERGTAEPLPYMLTSLLPTPGSSGGPVVDAVHGSVVGVFSGTRMDNWVEGQRGWGATGEGIFEMFSLPGFTPASRSRK